MQFDLKRKKRKVLAFLGPALEEQIGYVPGGTYGVKLSKDGSTLYVNFNGHPRDDLRPSNLRPIGFGLNAFFRNKMTWIGFSLPILIQLSVGLHHFFPAFPTFKIMHIRLDTYLTEKPWNAIGYFHLNMMYSIIGIAYMVPADVSLGLWFFYLLRKAQNILGAAMGWRGSQAGSVLARFPDINDQAVGAFFALFLLSLWMMRRHLWEVANDAISQNRIPVSKSDSEAMSYSTAVFGFLLGTFFLLLLKILFCCF